MNLPRSVETGSELRSLVRSGHFSDQTAGRAPDHLQGNVVILPQHDASDFLLFCQNNPKACPLIGLSKPGNPAIPALGGNIDIRFDVPRYRIYRNGILSRQVTDIGDLWQDDLVAFILGCSFTFEEALVRAGFGVRHIEQGRNVPMFKTAIDTIPGGVFRGPLVVTMRPYQERLVPEIFDLCSCYPHAHGTPVYWGDPQNIGIADLGSPDYGDAVNMKADEVPVFWACGVTPQAAIEAAKPELCITHAPGHMLVTDISSDRPPNVITGMSSFHRANEP